MTRDPGPTGATIGSVFLRVGSPELAGAVLRTLFGEAAITQRPGGWLEVSGDVDLFVEPVPDVEVPQSAGFGIRVADARQTARALTGVPGVGVGDLFEVAPGVAGFTCHGDGLPELFIHE